MNDKVMCDDKRVCDDSLHLWPRCQEMSQMYHDGHSGMTGLSRGRQMLSTHAVKSSRSG